MLQWRMIRLCCRRRRIGSSCLRLRDGYVAEIVADAVGTAAMVLGAGRENKDSEIDLAVGLMLNKKVGDAVRAGESLLTIHANRENVDEVKERLYAAIRIADKAEPPVLVRGVVTE